MAQIKEFSSADLNTISRFGGVSNTLEKINGVTVVAVASFTGLLDTYTGAAAAYSTRRLYSLYTGAALRVRRDSDDTEQDIGFDSNGDLDTAAIATFVGSGNNGYVTKWYGQESSGGTGSGNDAVQTTNANQPQIYNGTAVITENGQPALQLDGTNDYLEFPASFATNFYYSVFAVRQSSGTNDLFLATQDNNRYWADYGGDGQTATTIQDGFNGGSVAGDYVIYRKNGAAAFTTTTTRDQYHTAFYDGNQILMSFLTDGSALNSPFTGLSIGAYNGPSLHFGGTVQEFIMYQSTTGNQSSNASGIEGNVNAHFQIGNFPNPTSGLLATYTGAAAAYSVRQLANTAALAMRIREDGTDTETDIGFDSNGDLDTAAIASHCGANNGYVVTWYDQSGNQVDATQGTTTSQPQIYNGAAVLTENGKPAVDFQSDNLTVSGLAGVDMSDQTVIGVCKTDATGAYRSIFRLGETNDSVSTRSIWVGINNNAAGQFGSAAYNATLQFGGSVTSQSLGMYIGVDGGNGTSYVNGTQVAQSSNGTYGTSNGAGNLGGSASYDWDGPIQEVILYASDQSTNRTGIETDINTYFSIY